MVPLRPRHHRHPQRAQLAGQGRPRRPRRPQRQRPPRHGGLLHVGRPGRRDRAVQGVGPWRDGRVLCALAGLQRRADAAPHLLLPLPRLVVRPGVCGRAGRVAARRVRLHAALLGLRQEAQAAGRGRRGGRRGRGRRARGRRHHRARAADVDAGGQRARAQAEQELRLVDGAQGGEPDDEAERAVRAAGPERRGQDDTAEHAGRHDFADARRGLRVRPQRA
mmetsp:Transcript_20687/g.73065  ORF Transcript_20687/g.73065 Transcript_20687/m.73065 type:complete len:221 (-) Transcript_20687:233-895(-)